MTIYLDASAFVKRYVVEPGSREVNKLVEDADGVVTSLLTRAEVPAAIAKAVRMGLLSSEKGLSVLKEFRSHWEGQGLVYIQPTEALVTSADTLAWEYGLRGYDAVHLASAITLKASLRKPLVLATFDRQLWTAASKAGLDVWPEKLTSR